MTKSKIPEKKQRRTILRSFTAFNEVEKVITTLQKVNDLNIEVSILGPLTETKLYSEKSLSDLELEVKTRCEKLFESPLHFGTVLNPEIGSVFITGAFAPIFLQEINGKKNRIDVYRSLQCFTRTGNRSRTSDRLLKSFG